MSGPKCIAFDPTDLSTSPFRCDFPLLSLHPELAFLDSAATAQRPSVVLDAQRSFYETMNANALRGLYKLSFEATMAIGDARKKTSRRPFASTRNTPTRSTRSMHSALSWA